jgi:hypothetical protein
MDLVNDEYLSWRAEFLGLQSREIEPVRQILDKSFVHKLGAFGLPEAVIF